MMREESGTFNFSLGSNYCRPKRLARYQSGKRRQRAKFRMAKTFEMNRKDREAGNPICSLEVLITHGLGSALIVVAKRPNTAAPAS